MKTRVIWSVFVFVLLIVGFYILNISRVYDETAITSISDGDIIESEGDVNILVIELGNKKIVLKNEADEQQIVSTGRERITDELYVVQAQVIEEKLPTGRWQYLGEDSIRMRLVINNGSVVIEPMLRLWLLLYFGIFYLIVLAIIWFTRSSVPL